MTKTLTGYDVMVCQDDIKRHLKQCHICIQNVIIERKTLNDSCHKHALTLFHIQDICHVMVMKKISCQSYAHPFK